MSAISALLNKLIVPDTRTPDYLPVYYQACKDASALRSSVLMLGLSLIMGAHTPIMVTPAVC